MVKLKSTHTLSLDKSKQRSVVKQTKKLKKQIEDGIVTIKEQKKEKKLSAEQSRGLIYIAHIPHGFYENEMKNYFQQFGNITNVKVCRSKKTGNSKGYGYIEFSHPEVAKIAAESMNNYLMFKKRIVAEYIPYEKRPKHLFHGKASTLTRISTKIRREKQFLVNNTVDESQHLKRTKSRLSRLTKKLKKLHTMGIDSNFKPTDVPLIKQENDSEEKISHIYQPDPYDSEIEFKVPLIRSRKSLKSITSKISTKKSGASTDSLPKTSKVLLAKSLDSVKTLISKKSSSNAVADKSEDKKVNKATSAANIQKRKKRNVNRSKGAIKKYKKPLTLNKETVKKIARELVRKRGESLINYVSPSKKSKK